MKKKNNLEEFKISRVVRKEIRINGVVIKLTNELKKKFLPVMECKSESKAVVHEERVSKKVKMEDFTDSNKKVLNQFIEDQRGVSGLFEGWNKNKDFDTWEDFMLWHKGQSGAEK